MKNSLALSLVLSVTLFADQLDLDALVKEALLSSPDIKITKAQYEAAEQRTSQADADYLPQINLNAQIGAQNVDYADQSVGVAPDTIQPGSITTNLLSGQITAKQLVYDFGKTGGNMQSFSEQARASKSAMQQSISDKIFSVKQAYYNLLEQNALVEVNTENVKLNEQQLNRAQRYFQAGIKTKVDVTDAQVNLIEAQLDLQNVGYDTKLALVDLNKEVGFDSDKIEHEVYIEKPDLVDVYKSLKKPDYDITFYKQEAYKNRAELQQYQQLLSSSNAQLRQVDGDYYPGIYANGDYLVQKVDDNAFSPEQQWKATLSVEWNLYAGNKTSALSEEARINTMKAQADLDNIKLKIQKEVNDAFITLNKELDNTKLTESLSIASKEKFVQAQQRYEYGLADFVELQQARQTYIDSRASLTQAYFRYFTAVAQLERATGK